MIAFLPPKRLRITTLVPRIEKHVGPVGITSCPLEIPRRALISRSSKCLSPLWHLGGHLLGISAISTRARRVPCAQGFIPLRRHGGWGGSPQSEQTLRGLISRVASWLAPFFGVPPRRRVPAVRGCSS
jgi:hypothetical protein